MQTLRLTLQPLAALGTPLAGDTMFGHLCWILRHQHGNNRLTELLRDYTSGQPFAVLSDALPYEHVPLPSLPSNAWASPGLIDRKALKKKCWLPLAALSKSLPQWQQDAVTDSILLDRRERAQPHNTINRRTGTTGTGQFAPYTTAQTWLGREARFDLWLVFDSKRIGASELIAALIHMGQTGFGRDASIGMGKFELVGDARSWPELPGTSTANAWLTLGPSAPQGLGFCEVRSHWRIATRFGRHGDLAVRQGNPFKRPLLLAQAGSVFFPERLDPAVQFIGQGLGGAHDPISQIMPETVHQGYCPVLPIKVSGPSTEVAK